MNPDSLFIEGFTLQQGHYVALRPEPDGWFFARFLGLHLGVVDGWVRLRAQDGQILSTDRERADQEKHRADTESQRADVEAERARRLEERLRELGIDPDA